jgi:hypothetical protein
MNHFTDDELEFIKMNAAEVNGDVVKYIIDGQKYKTQAYRRRNCLDLPILGAENVVHRKTLWPRRQV